MDRDEQRQPGGGGCVADAPPEVPGHAVLRRLGAGASSVVWLLRRDDDGTLLAGRVLIAPFAGPPGTGAPGPGVLGAAADALGPIGLDHLVRSRGELVGSCAMPGHHHRVTLMDYLPGGSLAEVVGARGPLSPGETVTIITPLAQLLAAGHAAGLTHGDVSPGNVLFTVDGRPVLADWELAARPGRPGASGTGTDGFRDPGVGVADRLRPASDVYALAALAWFCLTGRVPGPAQHRPPLPVLVPAVPPALAVLLDRGMDPDPAARPRADELARGVFAAATPEPVDLHASVHASVRPELVTRREGDARVRRRRAAGRRPVGEAFRSPAPARDGAGRRRRRAPARPRWPSRRPSRGSRPWWVVAVVAVVVVVLGTGGAVLLLARGAGPVGSEPTAAATASAATRPSAAAASGRADPSPAALPAAGLPPVTGDPVAAARTLVELRARAFRDGRWDMLGRLTVAGSSAAVGDRAAAAGLVSGAGRLAGLRVDVTCAQRVRADGLAPGRAVVRVCARFSAYRQLDATGSVVRTVAASSRQEVQLQLARSPGGWRIEVVRGGTGRGDAD